jgi:hypothetical protein
VEVGWYIIVDLYAFMHFLCYSLLLYFFFGAGLLKLASCF